MDPAGISLEDLGRADRDAVSNPKTLLRGYCMKLKLILSLLSCGLLLTVLAHVGPAFAQKAPKRIEIVAKRFDFTPGEITLKKGEPVVLVLKSLDVPHGVRFRELNIETKANKGQTSELAFTPEKTGDFVGHCAVFCGAGHGKMALTLHVVE